MMVYSAKVTQTSVYAVRVAPSNFVTSSNCVNRDGDLFCTQTANSLLKRGYLEKTGSYFDMFRDLRLTEKGKNYLKEKE